MLGALCETAGRQVDTPVTNSKAAYAIWPGVFSSECANTPIDIFKTFFLGGYSYQLY